MAASLTSASRSGWEPYLDRIWIWVIAAIVLILIAYGPFFLTYSPAYLSPGYRFY